MQKLKAQETNVHKLLQGTKVFIVPNFQRRYSWRREQWQDLWDDVLAEYGRSHPDDSSETLDGHFLGSVVLHPAGGPASTVARYLVIDGQQRLTTLLVMLAALRDVRQEVDPDFAPAEYDNQYLTNPYNVKDLDRLQPTTFDRAAYVETVRKHEPAGGIGQAYSWFRARFEEGLRGTNFDLQRLGQTILLRLIVVEISTSQSDSVNNIFNTLNSKGMDLSPADLIRNEFLLNLSAGESDSVYEEFWLPLERRLVQTKARTGAIDDSKLINYFWSQELRYEPNLAAKDLFPTFERRLRQRVGKLSGAERDRLVLAEINKLYQQSSIYLTVLNPDDYHDTDLDVPAPLRDRLSWLSTWGSSPATPVIFALYCAFAEQRASIDQVTRSLDLILSLLVRRALAGVPTNNLNRLLSSLPILIEGSREPDELLSGIFSRPGYRWPSDAELVNGSQSTALYLTTRKAQSKFILSRLEEYLEPAEPAEFDDLTIEHVLPQTMTDEWERDIESAGQSIDDALSLVHTLGNLTLTGNNSKLGNDSFEEKRKMLGTSTVRLSQAVGRNSRWLPSDIRDRSASLAELAARIWRTESRGESQRDEAALDTDFNSPQGLKDALNSIPEGSWTSDEALSIALAMPVDEVRRLVSSLGPELARVVRTGDGSVPTWLPERLRQAVSAQAQPLDMRDVGVFVEADKIASLAGWVDGDDPDGSQISA